ncbi:PucR family transcriptional regulator [Bacillus coahuilensis]|uniref:PucR family transcriptional regulator n=1 Tax=Bacillus coahuilensis TaxID=408580 RepID=UPI0001850AD9|nr:helix-turn-helix domain-containing protein [Bacillus coahuilensis]
MIQNLIQLYPNALYTTTPPKADEFANRYWFQTTQNEYIGIAKNEMTEEGKSVLSCFYDEVQVSTYYISEEENLWKNFLFHQKPLTNKALAEKYYRILHFSIQGNEETDTGFISEGIKSFFHQSVVLLYQTPAYGIILEEVSEEMTTVDELTYASTMLESDLFVTIRFYFGNIHTVTDHLPTTILQEKKRFLFALSTIHNLAVFKPTDILPLYLLHKVDKAEREELFSKIYEVFAQDKDLFVTIKKYLENGSNLSSTAKELYMHRNSLQYRLDKYTDRTQIDLKTFSGAVTTYLACIDFEYYFSKVHK